MGRKKWNWVFNFRYKFRWLIEMLVESKKKFKSHISHTDWKRPKNLISEILIELLKERNATRNEPNFVCLRKYLFDVPIFYLRVDEFRRKSVLKEIILPEVMRWISLNFESARTAKCHKLFSLKQYLSWEFYWIGESRQTNGENYSLLPFYLSVNWIDFQ